VPLTALGDAVLSAGSASVFVDQSLAVPVSIAGVADLYDFQFDVAFTPAVVQLQSVTEGSFLDSFGPTVFLPGLIDNTSGTATFIADTLIGPISGASGGGTLINLNFRTLATGTSALTISNVILQDHLGNNIPFSTVPGMVRVSPSPVVPEPGYFWAAPALLACLVFIRRRSVAPFSLFHRAPVGRSALPPSGSPAARAGAFAGRRRNRYGSGRRGQGDPLSLARSAAMRRSCPRGPRQLRSLILAHINISNSA